MAIGTGGYYFLEKKKAANSGFLYLSVGLALLGAAGTYLRNPAWKSNYDLSLSSVNSASNSFRNWQAIGEETLLRYADKITPPSDTAKLIKQALDAFEKSHQIRPTFSNLMGLGNVALFKKDYGRSVKYFEEAFQLQPGNTMLKGRLAMAWREWGRYEGQVKNNLPQSSEYFLKSWAVDSTDVFTLKDLGAVFGMMQQPARSMYYLEKALQKEPTDQVLIRNLMIAYQQLGLTDKANALKSRLNN